MNRRNSNGDGGGAGSGPKLELKLKLSPARGADRGVQDSPTSSCVSTEAAEAAGVSPEATSMMLVGCPRCLMYVMLSEKDPKCPKCKSSVLLDVLHHNTAVKTTRI